MTIMPREQEIETVFSILDQNRLKTMLELLENYTPFQKLIATLLSARTRDSTTIPIVQETFKHYPTPKDFVTLPQPKLEKMIYGIGFYRTKAKHIKKLSAILLEKYNGHVPRTMEELTSLPGVGRKTAHCVLAYAFHQPAIAVDTHVHRISNRLGWVRTKTPEETELKLQKLIPQRLWTTVNAVFVAHGQSICAPINPKCAICPVKQYCVYGRKKLGLR